ncbi:MAG: hypothetical protein HYV02_04400 [Deltaproteobacteria bacterium]|nr:hypothetical protein [Deltaproteobacteria bacterium]
MNLGRRLGLLCVLALCWWPSLGSAGTIVVGGKNFTESYILGEMYAQLIEAHTHHTVVRNFGMGGTQICFEALRTGAIDLYPEYTGTIQEVILKHPEQPAFETMQQELSNRYALTMGPPLGFNNTYALALPAALSKKLGLAAISQLRRHPTLRFGLSHEFLQRNDGWPALARAYRLAPASIRGMEHGLTYVAIADGRIDITDAYSTDGKLMTFDLTLLQDDQHFFPEYQAVPLIREEVLAKFPELRQVLSSMAHRIDNRLMQRLNARADVKQQAFADIVHGFLRQEGLLDTTQDLRDGRGRQLTTLLLEHLQLTGIALAASLVAGLPLGILVARRRRLATPLLACVGLFQTIPSLAFLAITAEYAFLLLERLVVPHALRTVTTDQRE